MARPRGPGKAEALTLGAWPLGSHETRRNEQNDGTKGSRTARLAGLAVASFRNMSTYTLPKLRYPYDALEPYISRRILELHHDGHHAAYVKNANVVLGELER